MDDLEIWIGLADFKPKYGNDLLEDAKGAFVSILALANSNEHYYEQVLKLADKYNFELIELTNVEKFKDRIKK